MESLLKLLLSEAEQEKKKILEEADSYRQNIIKKAQEEAENLLAQAEQELQAKAQLEIERAQSALSLKEQSEMLQVKSQWLERVYQEVRNRLIQMRQDPKYPLILESLLAEVLKENEELVLAVNPKDLEFFEQYRERTGLNVPASSDPAIDLGVLAATKDGKVKIYNTLTDRLERAWLNLRGKVAQILWEES
jgi:vacuolar-type H+-ATPase subunit E/Vma4